MDFVVYIYYSWYVASISVFLAQFGENWKFENMGMNPRKFVLYFVKIEQDWEVFCLINCCREISYIVKVKIHVKWGRNMC